MASADRGAVLLESIRAMGRVRRRVVREIATSRSAAGAGVLIAVQEFGPVRQNALATHLSVDDSVASRQLSALLEAKLVEQVIDPKDGRAHLIQINERGRALIDRLRENAAAWLGDALANWSQDDLTTLTTLLQRLDHSLATPVEHSSSSNQIPKGVTS